MGVPEEGALPGGTEETQDEGLEPSLEEPEDEETGGLPEDDRPEALGEPPDEIPMDLYSDGHEEESNTIEEELQDVCPRCGEAAGTTDSGECKSCISDEVMTFAVNEAKGAHKEGADISDLTPDLKAAKIARQEKDYDMVISISERIVGKLEESLGRDLQPELAERKTGKRRKKKKKKKRMK